VALVADGYPSSRRAFWKNKFTRNKIRDRKVNRGLRRIGWLVLRIWEHELKKPAIVVARIKAMLSTSPCA
jgi:DNA mismatch endonuclease (patch repair protein)